MEKIFVCHSSNDLRKAKNLARFQKRNGFETWIDCDIIHGKNFISEINSALKGCDFFILLWSKSAENSKFVKDEWTSAFNLNKIIIPCKLDDTELPTFLNTIQYIDFKEIHRGKCQLLCCLRNHSSQP